MQRPSLGYLYVLSVPYVAAVSSASGASVGGLEYTGFLWSLTFAAGVLLILQYRKSIIFPWKLWAPWFGYVFLSLTWGGIHWRYNLQDPVQMLTPLVVGIVASFAIETDQQLEQLMRAFLHSLLVIAFVFVFFWYGPGASLQTAGTGYSVRPTAMTVAFIACICVAGMRRNAAMGLLGWVACLGIVALSESRMATFVVLILWPLSPLYRRVRSRVLVTGVMCLAALALFYSPIFQKRFFDSGSGDLQQVIHGEYSGSGRFELWPVIWRKAQSHIVFGVGAGEASRFALEAHLPEKTPLNDYLQILLEFGSVGLLIFLGCVLRQMSRLRKLLQAEDPAIVWASTTAFLGFATLLIFAWTENALVYGVHFMHPVFALTGAATGLAMKSGIACTPPAGRKSAFILRRRWASYSPEGELTPAQCE